MRKIKLLWYFRGIDARYTAKHFEVHLKEYLENLNLKHKTGVDYITDPIRVWMIVPESEMIQHRDALKPIEGELVE